MSIKNIGNLNKKDLKLLGSNDCFNVYKNSDGIIVKRFINNDAYNELLKQHDNDFISYLEYIKSLNLSIIAPIIDIYTNNQGLLSAYTSIYDPRLSIDAFYPKTDIKKYLYAIKMFFNELENIDDLRFFNIDKSDIIYDGLIKISSIDYSYIGENVKNDNVILFNKIIIDSLFNGCLDINSLEESLKELYNMTLLGEISAYDFLKEYMNTKGKKENKKLKYFRDFN